MTNAYGRSAPAAGGQSAGGTTSSQTESKIRTGSTHGLLRECAKRPRPGRGAPPPVCNIDGSHFNKGSRLRSIIGPKLQGGFAAVGTGTLPVWGPGAKRPGRRRLPAGGTTSSQTESEIRTGSTHGLLRECAVRPRPGRGAPPPVCNIDSSHFNKVRGSGQSWLTGIARRRSRRRHRHPAGLGSGGEAPRPPEAACGRNDQLTNRIEDSDGEHARSAARMRRKTAPRKGRASPCLQH